MTIRAVFRFFSSKGRARPELSLNEIGDPIHSVVELNVAALALAGGLHDNNVPEACRVWRHRERTEADSKQSWAPVFRLARVAGGGKTSFFECEPDVGGTSGIPKRGQRVTTDPTRRFLFIECHPDLPPRRSPDSLLPGPGSDPSSPNNRDQQRQGGSVYMPSFERAVGNLELSAPSFDADSIGDMPRDHAWIERWRQVRSLSRRCDSYPVPPLGV